ncbi:helix-turn-helix domain-containing protein [Streptomyces sp. KL116D]|uniref:helix-turn-helix domain-containing protein n=1 Tax=Streptomyces sp. KL116D TaxID=3045152 RepID=UPI00355903E5
MPVARPQELTYAELAARTEYSPDTLSRAVSGRSVPRNLKVVLAYAEACGLSGKEAEGLWKKARKGRGAGAQYPDRPRRSGSVNIRVVKDFAELHYAIVHLYHDDGRPAAAQPRRPGRRSGAPAAQHRCPDPERTHHTQP